MMARSLSLYFFALPFLFALNPAEGVDLHLSRLFALALFIMWMLRGLVRRDIRLPKSVPITFLLSFLFVSSVSCLWAANPLWSVRKSLFLLSFFPLLLVLCDMFAMEGRAIAGMLLKAFVHGAFLAASVGILQFVAQFIIGVDGIFHLLVGTVLPFFLGGSFGTEVAAYPSLLANIGGVTALRATAFFPDPHMFSYYMGMSLPFAVALAVLSRKSGERALYIGAAGVILLADLLSFSRGGYAGLVFAGFSTLVILRKQILSSYRSKVVVFLSFFIIFLFISIPNPVEYRLRSSFMIEEGSNSGRIAMWQEAGTHLLEAPFLGYGLGNYPLVVKPMADYREPIYAHDIFLDIAVETGLIGASFFSFGLFGGMFLLMKRQDILSRAAFVSLSLFVGHSLFENPLFSVHILPVFFLIIALLALNEKRNIL